MTVTLYTRQTCGYCVRAKWLLRDLDVPFTEIAVDGDFAALQHMREASGRRTVPQIWIGDFHVGGYDDLYSLHRAGKLMPLLKADAEAAVNQDD